MDPDKIELENLSRSFEYFKYASEIDKIEDIVELKNIAKSYEIDTGYQRPLNLATDSAGKIETIFDILKYEENKNNIQFDPIVYRR